MSILTSCKYAFILTFSALVLSGTSRVYAQATDTTATDSTSEHKVKKKDLAGHQLNIGFDISRPVINSLVSNQMGYEFAADYYMHNELYLAAEGGWGSSTVNYTDLKYNTKNDFLRFGFNKSILTRDRPTDWDMMFVGMRVAAANVNRTPATFTVIDSVWGSNTGSSAGKDFTAVWAELTGGMRVEFFKGLSAGWNFRGKILLNNRSFNDLAPLYIAGYGKGDKNVVFDLNVYISYGIRWNRKSLADTTAVTK